MTSLSAVVMSEFVYYPFQHKRVNCPEANTLSHLGRTKKRGGSDIIHLTVASKELDTNNSHGSTYKTEIIKKDGWISSTQGETAEVIKEIYHERLDQKR